MLTATKENTVEVTPAELRELANCLEKADQNSTGDALVWFNDKILFKYSKILLDTVPKIEGSMEFKKTRYGTICIDKDLPEPDDGHGLFGAKQGCSRLSIHPVSASQRKSEQGH